MFFSHIYIFFRLHYRDLGRLAQLCVLVMNVRAQNSQPSLQVIRVIAVIVVSYV